MFSVLHLNAQPTLGSTDNSRSSLTWLLCAFLLPMAYIYLEDYPTSVLGYLELFCLKAQRGQGAYVLTDKYWAWAPSSLLRISFFSRTPLVDQRRLRPYLKLLLSLSFCFPHSAFPTVLAISPGSLSFINHLQKQTFIWSLLLGNLIEDTGYYKGLRNFSWFLSLVL